MMALRQLKLFRFPFNAMGSPCEIQLYTVSPQKAQQTATAAIADVQRLEKRYSRYLPSSILSKINRHAAEGKSIKVDPETALLLNYAETCYIQSEGLFDISAGVLRKVWKKDRKDLPDQNEIDEVLALVGFEKLHWNPPLLSFQIPGLELDFGGIVKEYAADRAAKICTDKGVSHGAVNLGGDIKIIGPHPDNSPWLIGIRDPHEKNATLKTVALISGGLASSGDYERCMIVNGRRYSHIVNPKTGWPVNYFSAVSVVADLCVLAGSASTITMLKEADGVAWIENLGLRHIWVDISGRVGGSI
ncbi:MAG: FAD:protein FMN transferase [Methylobacter sp.]